MLHLVQFLEMANSRHKNSCAMLVELKRVVGPTAQQKPQPLAIFSKLVISAFAYICMK
jgi:hypothetical protein